MSLSAGWYWPVLADAGWCWLAQTEGWVGLSPSASTSAARLAERKFVLRSGAAARDASSGTLARRAAQDLPKSAKKRF